MFHSNTSGSSDIQFTDQAMFDRSFINDVNPHHSKQQEPEPPLLLFHLPQSFVVNDYHHQHHDHHHHQHRHHQEEEDDDFLHNHHHELLVNQLFPQEQQQQQLLTGNITSSSVAVSNKAIMTGCPSNILPSKKKYSSSTLTGQIPRKRSTKKDRHSKIFTAQGPRDRRMRLSLEIARKFFDLQDILGFDKASKTVEWLLMQSMGAIKELTGGLNINTKSSCNGADKSVSSTSECEVISTINDNSNKGNPSASVPKEKKLSHSRKATYHPPSKESREKARAKARERAREKKLNRRLEESKQCPEITVPHYLNQFRSSSPSGNHSHEMKSSLEVVAEIDEPDYHRRTTTGDIVDESFVITSKLSPLAPMVFDYSRGAAISQGLSSNNNFPSFLENWDIEGNRTQPNYYAVTNSHPSTGNVQERLSSSIFLTTSDIRFQSQFADIQF